MYFVDKAEVKVIDSIFSIPFNSINVYPFIIMMMMMMISSSSSIIFLFNSSFIYDTIIQTITILRASHFIPAVASGILVIFFT